MAEGTKLPLISIIYFAHSWNQFVSSLLKSNVLKILSQALQYTITSRCCIVYWKRGKKLEKGRGKIIHYLDINATIGDETFVYESDFFLVEAATAIEKV